MDLVVGDEGADRRQGADDLDDFRREPDLLLGLAQRRVEKPLARVAAPAWKGDLAGVPLQVRAALGEDETWVVRPAVHRHEYRGLGAPVRVEPLGLGGVE